MLKEPAPQADDRISLWLVGLSVVICIVASVLETGHDAAEIADYWRSDNIAPAYGVLTADALIRAVLVWIVFYPLALRGLERPRAGALFFGLFLLLSLVVGFAPLTYLVLTGPSPVHESAPAP